MPGGSFFDGGWNLLIDALNGGFGAAVLVIVLVIVFLFLGRGWHRDLLDYARQKTPQIMPVKGNGSYAQDDLDRLGDRVNELEGALAEALDRLERTQENERECVARCERLEEKLRVQSDAITRIDKLVGDYRGIK